MYLDTYQVKVKMAELGWDLLTLSSKTGLSYGNTSHIVKNSTQSTVNIGKIAKALGCEVEAITKERKEEVRM